MADKLCRSNGVGMSEAIDLAIAEAMPPTAAKREQFCYMLCTLYTIFLYHYFLKHILQEDLPHNTKKRR
jgi:hypothetical protein